MLPYTKITYHLHTVLPSNKWAHNLMVWCRNALLGTFRTPYAQRTSPGSNCPQETRGFLCFTKGECGRIDAAVNNKDFKKDNSKETIFLLILLDQNHAQYMLDCFSFLLDQFDQTNQEKHTELCLFMPIASCLNVWLQHKKTSVETLCLLRKEFQRSSRLQKFCNYTTLQMPLIMAFAKWNIWLFFLAWQSWRYRSTEFQYSVGELVKYR